MGAGDDPKAIFRIAAIELRHKIKAMGAFIEVRTVPLCGAILVPGNRAAEMRMFEPNGLIEGRKVGPVDGLGDGQ